jgi:hypothetical protein
LNKEDEEETVAIEWLFDDVDVETCFPKSK